MQLPSCSPHLVAPVRILRSDFQQYHQKQIFTTLKKTNHLCENFNREFTVIMISVARFFSVILPLLLF